MERAEIRQSAEAAARALQAQRFDEAETYALRALAGQAGEPLASEVIGVIRIDEQRFDEAIVYLKAGWEAAPESAELPNLIGTAYAEKGELKTALGYFQRAAQAAPNHPMPWQNLGMAAFNLRQWSHARAAFERCRKIDHENVEASAGLARLELKANDPARALELASPVVGRNPDHLFSRHVVAEANLRLGNYEQAFAEAIALTQHPEVWPKMKVLAFGIAADAANALGRYDEAFAYYTATNNATAEIHRRDIEQAQNNANFEKLTTLAKITPQLAKKAARWPKPFDRPAPVFFIGFARSGMSVLEKVLRRHPSLVSSETMPNADSWVDILWAKDTPERLAALTYEDIQGLRADYWKLPAIANIEVPEGSRLFEYKPFYSQHLALFAMVLPDAKYIFAHRDPRDVVLSCFQRRFSPGLAMYEFLDLESAAHYYDLAMGAAWATREAFDLDFTEVGYEKLVADLEGEVRRVIEFLGLPWDDDLLCDQEKASEGEMKATSAPRLAQPVYTHAPKKWHNYEAHLAPVRSILDTWAVRFGYDKPVPTKN